MSQDRDYMDRVFLEYVRIAKALSSEKRLEILHRLIHGPKTVEQLTRMTDMTTANTSRHLQVLKEASLVTIERDGKYIWYSISTPTVETLLSAIHSISEEQSPMLNWIEQSYIDQNQAIRTIELEEAKNKVFSSQAQLVDLRSASEFELEHVAGAVNIPFNQLEEHLEELQRDKPIILYCRGLFCTYANQAAAYLNKKGYDAYSVRGTHFDWKRADEE
ncbi:ArsR/SmtB family transcription factor [Streptococcus plurextorum]|uniref:ArsR/SmtB family transcription factor n=1 Tax=Streptococcus plurextorum TaxID=456876 RepID=UPI0003FB364E|nr:metalloregulator ArsR/SmtB family transcription factor [Streptococcus plurextorum]